MNVKRNCENIFIICSRNRSKPNKNHDNVSTFKDSTIFLHISISIYVSNQKWWILYLCNARIQSLAYFARGLLFLGTEKDASRIWNGGKSVRKRDITQTKVVQTLRTFINESDISGLKRISCAWLNTPCNRCNLLEWRNGGMLQFVRELFTFYHFHWFTSWRRVQGTHTQYSYIYSAAIPLNRRH